MNARIKKSIFALIFTLSIPFGLTAQTSNPPDNGALGTTINTSTTAQVKNGDLSVNAFSAVLNSYFASKVGVGTASILATLDVTPTVTATIDLKNIKSGLIYNGGSAMTNYYGAYIAAPTGSGSITNKYALVTEPTAGKVGIGTITPASQLSVAGGIQMSDDASTCTVTNAGTMRWHASALQVCDGAAWASTAAAPTCLSGQLCGVGKYVAYTPYQGCPSNTPCNTPGIGTRTCEASSPMTTTSITGGNTCTCPVGYVSELLTSNSVQNYEGPQYYYNYSTGQSTPTGVLLYGNTYTAVTSCRKN